MKKKNPFISKDKRDWLTFTKKLENIYDKASDFSKQKSTVNKIRKLDLHGFSLEKANHSIKRFIDEALSKQCKKLLIVTGKGSRSKIYNDPYRSEKMNILKYSVPWFIRNNEDLLIKIKKISKANLKDGGEGAFYIFLRKQKNL